MGGEGGGGGRLFEAGHLLTFSAFRMGTYLRWALIRGWALIQINTVWLILYSANPLNKDTKGAIESVRIEGVSVLSRLNLEKKGFLSTRTKQTVYNNEVSILSGCP